MHDRISVIIPTYDRSHLVGRAIESALTAISAGDEILVIDDGSTDGTPEAVKRFGKFIRYVRTENFGPSAARNAGIRLATCPLVAFLDSDDEWAPEKLELQRRVMDRFPDIVFCFSNFSSRLPTGQVRHDILDLWRQASWTVGSPFAPAHLRGYLGAGVPFSSLDSLPPNRTDFNVHVGDMYLPLMEVLYVWICSAVVRKRLAGDLFQFPEDSRLLEDWECLARIARVGPAAYLDCELAVQNVHRGPRLTDADQLQISTARLKVLERVWGEDLGFMSKHESSYKRLLGLKRLHRIKLLLNGGQLEQAREELKKFKGPLAYRLITSLPPVLVLNLLGIKRKITKALISSSITADVNS